MRVLKGRAIRLTHTFLDSDEETPLVLTAVAVTLTDGQGSTVASVDATKGTGEEWTAILPMQDMGVYTATWDGTDAIDETPVEVVGGFLFTVPQARNSDDDLKDAIAFPASEIIDYREVVEREFERITSRSFTTRVKEINFVSDGSREHVMLTPDAQSILSVSVNGTDVADLTGWTISTMGKVTTPDLATCDGDSVRLKVLYGFTTPPADVARAGTIRLRSLLAAENSAIPDRATTWQPEEGGTFRLATPGSGKWRTGIPEVDTVLRDYSLDVVLSVYAGG